MPRERENRREDGPEGCAGTSGKSKKQLWTNGRSKAAVGKPGGHNISKLKEREWDPVSKDGLCTVLLYGPGSRTHIASPSLHHPMSHKERLPSAHPEKEDNVRGKWRVCRGEPQALKGVTTADVTTGVSGQVRGCSSTSLGTDRSEKRHSGAICSLIIMKWLLL